MQRRREVAAAPERGASQAWDAIGELVAATLERSPEISKSQVATVMTSAAGVGAMLIAAGHLDIHPLVVVADPVHLSITTVSGASALSLDEDLGAVPGGASATEWMVYLPTPEPVGDAVRSAIAGSPHLSAEEPPGESGSTSSKAATGRALNLDALVQRAEERR